MKKVALVPLRGGSKSIPKKNIKFMTGKPLCAWVLEAACKADLFDQVYVSTEDNEVASVVESLKLGVEIIERPATLADDESTTESVMLHFAKTIDFDVLATIQATSPLVQTSDFKKAMKQFENEKLDSLLTAVRLKRFLWSADGKPLNYDPLKRPMRQHFNGSLMENGAFYYTTREILDKYKSRLGGKTGIYEMPVESAVEIDEPEDWSTVEALLKKRTYDWLHERLVKIKLLAMDCDGVLTDAGMYYAENGDELKKFNTRDGMGLSLLRKKGIRIAIVTGEDSRAVKHRAEKLEIDDLYMGVKDKSEIVSTLIKKYGLQPENVVYIGDDINDLKAFEVVGLKVAVNDAVEEIKKEADLIMETPGGRGAVRELADLILELNFK